MYFSKVPSGKRLHSYGTSPFGVGKSTVNEPFSIAILVYKKVNLAGSNVLTTKQRRFSCVSSLNTCEGQPVQPKDTNQGAGINPLVTLW